MRKNEHSKELRVVSNSGFKEILKKLTIVNYEFETVVKALI